MTQQQLIASAHKAASSTRAHKVSTKGKSTPFLSDVRFADLVPLGLDPHLARCVTDVFAYTSLSVAQAAYIPTLISHPQADAFVRAGTGSGKTLGFLLPVLNDIVARSRRKSAATQRQQQQQQQQIQALVIAPSRDLALQTFKEAQRFASSVPGLDLHAGVCVGGMPRAHDLRMLLDAAPPKLLVASPGRLLDVLSEKEVQLRFASVDNVVLDEADALLTPDFIQAVNNIMTVVGPRHRTLMFSATITDAVKKAMQRFMRPDFQFLSAAVEPRLRIRQCASVVPPDQIFRCLHRVLLSLQQQQQQQQRSSSRSSSGTNAFKVLVFFPSNALVAFVKELFRNSGFPDLLSITGGDSMPQSMRNRNAEAFRKSTNVVMFASDAVGRGMDFPNVTLVVQIGVVTPTVYRQRIGRTGRAGGRGQAILILGDDEQAGVLRALNEDMRQKGEENIAVCSAAPPGGSYSSNKFVTDAKQEKLGVRAFKSLMGAYKSNVKTLKWSREHLIDAMKARFRGLGLSETLLTTLGQSAAAAASSPRVPRRQQQRR